MTTENRSPLELDVVARRFAESADALSDVREQLQILTELRETEEEVNASLGETARQVASFVTEAEKALKGLEEAQVRAAEVLKAGADLLDGTELKSISELAQANSQAIDRVDKRIEGLNEMVTALPGQLKGMADETKASAEVINQVEKGVGSLNEMVTALPGQITGVEEVAQGNSSAIYNVDGQVSAIDAKMAGVTDRIRQISELAQANSQAISGIERRFDALESKLSEILVAAKEPKIVKRFF